MVLLYWKLFCGLLFCNVLVVIDATPGRVALALALILVRTVSVNLRPLPMSLIRLGKREPYDTYAKYLRSYDRGGYGYDGYGYSRYGSPYLDGAGLNPSGSAIFFG